MNKAINLAFAAVLASATTQVFADLVTFTYEGYISQIYTGVSDSKLGLGMGDTFSGSITIDTETLSSSGAGYEGGMWYSYYGGYSQASLVNTDTLASMSSTQSSVFVENDYPLTVDDIAWLDANYPGHGAVAGDPDDYLAFGGVSSDSVWNNSGYWDYGYEFEIGFDFFSTNIINDNSLPDFNSLDLSGSDLSFFNLYEEVNGSRTFDAEGMLTSYSYSVSAVPVPAAVWLFGSGLLGLVGMARRKKAA